ncbi:MAG: YfiT family bacillithiol transferase [Ferruginibacter sp.]
MEDLKYPIGKYTGQPFSQAQMEEWLLDIQSLPQQIEYAITNLDQYQLDTPYRDGGWTVQQVVHHVADSHMNAYIRFKLGLTEDNPTIKPYNEAAWAEMSDTKNLPINISITLLHAMHSRWFEILKNIKADQWERKVFHPEHKKEMTLWYLLGNYAWHGKHHSAHITQLRERMNW